MGCRHVAAFVFFVATLLTTYSGAFAWTPNQESGCSTGVSWSISNPVFHINTTTNDFDTSAKLAAVTEPLDTINYVGDANIAPQWVSWPYDSEFPNTLSEIFISDDVDDNFSGVTMIVNGGGQYSCVILEADVIMNADRDFVYSVPSTYYDPDVVADGGERYMRALILHEMGHAIGLGHEDDAFSMMNYWHPTDGGPFVNRSSAWMVDALPDAREGLREIYPDSGSERDLAVLNLWVDSSDIFDPGATYPVAYAKKLCKPAKGTGWTSSIFAEDFPYCATSPSVTVCPGDSVRTRFAVANYGTSSETATLQLWFSTDESLNLWQDTMSSTTVDKNIAAATSYRAGQAFTVPSVAKGNWYYLLARVGILTSPIEEHTQNNWMPLRGQVYVPNSCP
ncbi:MAG: hypothetical protein M5R36_08695 [Deltaproteobacteria bacterium]|nr:hypothetical protein [Deltaproteobacteria bacterium]